MSAGLATLASFLDTGLRDGAERRLIEVDRDGTRRTRTVAELARASEPTASALAETAPGADVVLAFASAHDLVPALWACLRAGRTAVVWHDSLPGSGDDGLRDLAGRLRSPLLVSTSLIADRITASGRASFSGVVRVDALAEPRGGEPVLPRPGDGALLVATSGTTGRAKLVVVPHHVWWTRTVRRGALEERRSHLVFAPLDGITGMQVLLAPFCDTVYVQPGRVAAVPEELPALVQELALQSLSVSSSMAARVADVLAADPARYDLSSLELLRLGTEQIVPGVVERLCALLRQAGAGALRVGYGYGATETGLLCRTAELDPDDPAVGADPVSVGGAIPGWSIRVVDEQVEVFSEEQIFAGYRDDPAATAAAFTPDGWYRTGDRGVLRDGELTLTGREQATIVVGGRTVSLDGIEATVRAAGVPVDDVVAVAHRPPGAKTDELLVFLVEPASPPRSFDAVCREVRTAVGVAHGLSARLLVGLTADELPRTASGKLRREELVRRYAAGHWAPHVVAAQPSEADATGVGGSATPWLRALWQEVLELDAPPASDVSFYALGGDSLAAAEIVVAVETRHECRLDLAAFFADPTIATLERLLAQPAEAGPAPDDVVHGLERFQRSWRGERLLPGGLIVTSGAAGARDPLCWVFQAESEFAALGAALGPEQPLHAMRSCVGLVPRYTAPVLDAVCDRFVPELLALPDSRPVTLGGNCQGAIVALALARRLREHGRPPARLVLMEWSFFAHGGYDGPTLLLHGEESYTAAFYDGSDPSPPWRADFPDCAVVAIPGAHGQFFDVGRVEGLAAALRSR